MRLTKELNTSCKATFKDGHSEEYSTIEEASEKTGLTVASIKIRCNKPGSGGKDKTTFEWLDKHTKLHYQAKKNRNKGNNFELEVVKQLKEIGFDGCISSRSESKNMDNGKVDIIDKDDKLPIYLQCKHLQNTPQFFAIKEGCPFDDKPFGIIWKKSAEGGSISPGTIAMIDIDFFYKLLQLYYEKNYE